MHNSQQKPWLNDDGSIKSDAEMRAAGKNWPSSVWESYLATLEVERRRKDAVLSPSEMDNFSTEQNIGLAFSMARERHPLLKVMMDACIRDLTSKQRDVIIRRYWDNKTVAEIAASKGISKQAVHKTMKTALAKIKTNFTSSSFRRRVMAMRAMLAS